MMSHLADLNEAQRRAATHGDGHLLVIAGAGTGKTKTLAARVAHLIESGVSPERILLLTFTRRAAQEMLARAGRAVGRGAAGNVWGGTFHSVANRLLRQHGRAVGLSTEFTVLDQSDAADVLDLIRGELGLGESRRRFPKKGTLIAIYSRMVNSRTRLAEVTENYFPWCHSEVEGIRTLFEAYTRRKREQNVLDYDDLLLFWHALLGTGHGPRVAAQFDHVLVDEYQDTNSIQAEILLRLAGGEGKRPRVMVVGDDAQAIYSFRAATVRNILDFPAQFGGAETVTLEQNYRSTQPILDASNAVIARARERYTKNLFTTQLEGEPPRLVTCQDESGQCDAVCEFVLGRLEQGTPLREQAVLFRAGHHSDQLEVELSRRNIPFVKYGGLKFLEAAHVKDMVALLRLMENPSDELAWRRVLLLLEGIGPSHARRMSDHLLGRLTTEDDRGVLRRLEEEPPEAPQGAVEEFGSLRSLLLQERAALPAGKPGRPAEDLERIRRFYEPVFRRVYDHAEVRLRDLEQLEQIAQGYSSRSQFLTDLTLDPPASTQDLAGPPLLDEDYLILSTIHSAKGCEWDAVHVLHCSDGIIPSDMATGSPEEVEEERRLLYVAMTRARKSLTLYFPQRYYHHPWGRSDRHSFAQLSRFLPDEILPLFNRVTHAAPGDEPPPVAAEGAPASSVTQAVDALLGDLL